MKNKQCHPKPFHRLKQFLTKLHKPFKKFRDYDLAVVLSVLHSLISIPLSNLIFLSPEDQITKRNKLLIDILFFVIMIFVYRGLIFVIKNRHKYRKHIKFCLIYFTFLILFLLLTWPGIWRGPNDEFIIASNAKHYVIYGWQHSLTALFYMFCFKLIPFFSSVLIVQCFIISLITTYLYTRLIQDFHLKKLLPKLILLIPFLLPPVIDYALYPLRPTLYSYFVVLLLYLMIKAISIQKLSKLESIFLIISFIIAASWRSEGIFFLIIAVIYFIYLAIRHFTPIRFSLYAIIIILFSSLVVNAFQSTTLETDTEYAYKVLSTASILPSLVRTASQDPDNTDLLSSIDKVMDVNILITDPQNLNHGDLLFFGGAYKPGHTHAEYLDYIQAFLRLCLKYPTIAAHYPIKYFFQAICTSATLNNATAYTHFFEDSYYQDLYENNNVYHNTKEELEEKYSITRQFITEGGDIMQPINPDLRNTIIEILEGREIGNYTKQTPLAAVFWNALIPFFSIIFIIIVLIIKKHPSAALIISTILIKTFIVILTAPIPLHMYYYAEYLLGYILLALFLAHLTNHRTPPSLLTPQPKINQTNHK